MRDVDKGDDDNEDNEDNGELMIDTIRSGNVKQCVRGNERTFRFSDILHY